MRLWLAPLTLGLGGCLECEHPLEGENPPFVPSDTADPVDPDPDPDPGTDTADPPVDLPPRTAIVAPTPDFIVRVPADNSNPPFFGEIDLEGFAEDPEDGPLHGTSLQWTTDNPLQDASLGEGESLVAKLVVERCAVTAHTLTLSATDSAGQTTTDSVEITVHHICPG